MCSVFSGDMTTMYAGGGWRSCSISMHIIPDLQAGPLPCNDFLVVIGEVLQCTCWSPRTERYT